MAKVKTGRRSSGTFERIDYILMTVLGVIAAGILLFSAVLIWLVSSL